MSINAIHNSLKCLLLLSLIVLLLLNCSDDKGTDVNPEPGKVQMVIRDADGEPIESPSIGALLIECSDILIDEAKTDEENEEYPIVGSYKVSDNVYRILVVADNSQCNSDLMGCIYCSDLNELSNAKIKIIDMCSSDNRSMNVNDYSIGFVE